MAEELASAAGSLFVVFLAPQAMKSGFRELLVLSLVLFGHVLGLAGTESDTGDTAAVAVSADPWGRVRVDRVTVDDGQLFDTLDIYFEAEGIDLAGYVLKLGLASQLVGVIEILPGEIIDSCDWEMFRANRIPLSSDIPQITELWQVTALAQMTLGEEAPVCSSFDRPVSLARLVVSSAHVPIAPDAAIAVFFYWETCRDNVLSDREGASIIISDTVFSPFPVTFDTERDQFPTCHGTPSECISPRAANAPRRLVEFRNGGVEFRLRIDEPGVDSGLSTE